MRCSWRKSQKPSSGAPACHIDGLGVLRQVAATCPEAIERPVHRIHEPLVRSHEDAHGTTGEPSRRVGTVDGYSFFGAAPIALQRAEIYLPDGYRYPT
jgi:hypothetical protein